jgi:hypothetical protein
VSARPGAPSFLARHAAEPPTVTRRPRVWPLDACLILIVVALAGLTFHAAFAPRVVRHPAGVFEDTSRGTCFRLASTGEGAAFVVEVPWRCPSDALR